MTTEKDITLGEFLRHERERRGITIEQVASATKVGVRTLHALEADHFAELPARPFIRGFVTSYCRFIGLDTKEVLSRFEDYIQRKSVERPNRDGGHSGYAFEKKDGEQQSRTILLIAMFSFIVLGGLAMLFLKPSLRHHHNSHIDKLRAAHGDVEPLGQPQLGTPSPLPSLLTALPVLATSSVVSKSPEAKLSPSPSPDDEADEEPKAEKHSEPLPEGSHAGPGSNPNDPLDSGHGLQGDDLHHKVVFKPLADIWVRYQVDDRPARKFIVRKGKTLILRAKDSIRVQVSNPNSVAFQYNGKGSGLVSESKFKTVKQGVSTLFFPHELAEKIENPFPDEKPLPETPDPVPDSLSTAPSPSP